MSTYLLINSDTLLAKQFVKTIRPSDDAVWELHFAEASVTEERNNEAPHLSVCDPEDDWRLNYELERAFLEFGYFDDVILFPGALKFGAIEAIPSRTINEQVSRQITSVIEIYRILADKLRSHKSCHITQFLYEESYEFSALSSLPMAVNGALRGLVNGLRKEFLTLNVDIDIEFLKPDYKDFINFSAPLVLQNRANGAIYSNCSPRLLPLPPGEVSGHPFRLAVRWLCLRHFDGFHPR